MGHQDRQELPLIPSSVDISRLPEPLRDDGRALTAEEAQKTYLKITRDAWKTEGRTSKHTAHRKGIYPRILEADRSFQERYAGLTTAKISRDLSPYDASGDRMTLWELDQILNGGSVRQKVRSSLDYQLSQKCGFEYEWVAVTSVTRTTGTPQEHIYIWIDDPKDDVSKMSLFPAHQKHIERCDREYSEAHEISQERKYGSITLEHSPSVVDHLPEKFFEIREESETEARPVTKGAQFVASKLIHLHIGDYVDSEQKDPPEALLEGAALAWASPYKWFRASSGVPSP